MLGILYACGKRHEKETANTRKKERRMEKRVLDFACVLRSRHQDQDARKTRNTRDCCARTTSSFPANDQSSGKADQGRRGRGGGRHIRAGIVASACCN